MPPPLFYFAIYKMKIITREIKEMSRRRVIQPGFGDSYDIKSSHTRINESIQVAIGTR